MYNARFILKHVGKVVSWNICCRNCNNLSSDHYLRMRVSISPPSVPSHCTCTPYYCEENIYLLASSFHDSDAITQLWDINVVFVSNHYRTVALWNQKQSRDPDLAHPVVWDYHCILVLRPRARAASASAAPDATWAWVFDYDSRLAMPCCWSGECLFCSVLFVS
jgi:protein N-terminal glutamine amidohydrolase